MCNRFDRIPACDIQTDRQTDILRWHSPRDEYVSAMHMHPAVKSIYSRVDISTSVTDRGTDRQKCGRHPHSSGKKENNLKIQITFSHSSN